MTFLKKTDQDLIDSVDDRWGLDYSFTTTQDVNNDGRPELLSSIYGSPNLYQWNSSVNRMQLLKSLPPTNSMWPYAENVDGDVGTEIIMVNAGLGDSLIRGIEARHL